MERDIEMNKEIKKLVEHLLFLVELNGDKFLDETDFNYYVCEGYHQLTDEEKIIKLKKAIIMAKEVLYYGEGPYSS